jgi:protein-tyrosine phosphatase
VIDTHCHLLPRIDDGPRTANDAVRLARRLRDEGITTVVCTPHFSDRWPTPTLIAHERHRELRRALEIVAVDLATTVAAEVSVGRALETPLARLVVRAIGGRFLLVELVRDTPPHAAHAVADRLAASPLVPIFAHPERCRAVQHDPSVLADARARGALVQVVAPSLAGRSGDAVWKTAWTLVETGVADLLASDAHADGARMPAFAAVAALVAARCGDDRREALTETGPRRVLEPATAS